SPQVPRVGGVGRGIVEGQIRGSNAAGPRPAKPAVAVAAGAADRLLGQPQGPAAGARAADGVGQRAAGAGAAKRAIGSAAAGAAIAADGASLPVDVVHPTQDDVGVGRTAGGSHDRPAAAAAVPTVGPADAALITLRRRAGRIAEVDPRIGGAGRAAGAALAI